MATDTTSLGEVMARIDERTKANADELGQVLKKIDELPKLFVTWDAFTPVRNIAYAAVGFLCLTVGGAIVLAVIALFIRLTKGN